MKRGWMCLLAAFWLTGCERWVAATYHRGDSLVRAAVRPDKWLLHDHAHDNRLKEAEAFLKMSPLLVNSPAHALAGRMPLHLAAENGHLAMIELLLARRARVDLGDHLKRTPLYLAVARGHHQCARRLLDAGADPDAANNLGVRPLFLASYAGDLPTTRELLRFGAEVNAKSPKSSFTPLMLAVLRGDRAPVELLLANGAAVNERTQSGATALDMTERNPRKELGDLLRRHGARRGSGQYSINEPESWR